MKKIASILAIIAWCGIILQLYTGTTAYLANGRTIGGTIIELLSFFTLQCNLLVAVCLTAAALSGYDHGFFKNTAVLTAAAVYITIVSLVYNLVLRQLWQPTGLTRVGDEMVHLVTPVLFVLYWLIFVPKNRLTWISFAPWLWYPFLYIIYILVRGSLSGLYPYPFINVSKLGYLKVIINSGGLMILFLLISLLYIFAGRLMSRRQR